MARAGVRTSDDGFSDDGFSDDGFSDDGFSDDGFSDDGFMVAPSLGVGPLMKHSRGRSAARQNGCARSGPAAVRIDLMRKNMQRPPEPVVPTRKSLAGPVLGSPLTLPEFNASLRCDRHPPSSLSRPAMPEFKHLSRSVKGLIVLVTGAASGM